MSEHTEQAALVRWAAYHHDARLDMLFAIPNGGWRHVATARRLKEEGVKAGVPDLFLAVPCGKWHGLFVEMKAGQNTTTDAQDAWLEALAGQGYRTAVCHGFDEARATLESYLAGEG
jgi:hypothetical protein